MKRSTLLITVVALVTLFAAACGQASSPGTRTIEITITNDGFSPDPIEVQTGDKIQFVVHNETGDDYEFESDEARIEETVIPAGKTREMNWTAPSKAGTYEFEYYVPGTSQNSGDVVVTR